jgi:hypothetical protein
MVKGITAKYLSIVWQDENIPKQIVESQWDVEFFQTSEFTFDMEITTFPKVQDGSFGLFSLNISPDLLDGSVPFFVVTDSEKNELKQIVDVTTQKKWWFAADYWNKKNKYWSSTLFRTSGFAELKVGRLTFNLKISASSFNYEQFLLYIDGFKGDFLELMLNDSSYVKVAIRNPQEVFSAEIEEVEVFSNLLGKAEKILQKPKIELKEHQLLKPRGKVVPVFKTYREIATKGLSKQHTSRGFFESLDVPENRYVHYVLNWAYNLLQSLLKASKNYEKRLAEEQVKNQLRLDGLINTVQINEAAVNNEFKRQLAKWGARKKTVVKYVNVAPNMNHMELVFTVSDHFMHDPSCGKLFVTVRKAPNTFLPWEGLEGSETLIVSVARFTKLSENLRKFDTVKVIGAINSVSLKFRTGRPYIGITIYELSGIELISSRESVQLQRKQNQIKAFEKNGWIKFLSAAERSEQDKERASILKKGSLIASQLDRFRKMVQFLEPKIPHFKRILLELRKNKISLSSHFPNSMTFIQNVNYQAIHSSFKKLKELSGVDESVFESIDKVSKLDVVNISLLYERWCLIQVARVLIEQFNYLPEQGWKERLITSVLKNQYNISIELNNPQTSRKITLRYEYELKSKKRPDIILDMAATVKEFHGNEFSEYRLDKRLIIDAKFYEDVSDFGGIDNVINELYLKKDYGEGQKNFVYIAHPSPKGIINQRNPLSWAQESYLGEVSMFEWDDDQDFRTKNHHKYGAIKLSPVDNLHYVDQLKRLIGMFIQYGAEQQEKAWTSYPKGVCTCISCGSANINTQQLKAGKSGGIKFWLTCLDCQHFSVMSYCGSCGSRLIKNGAYWTYHSTDPFEPFNIKCPSCESFI